MINKLKYAIILFIVILILTYYLRPNMLTNNSVSMVSTYVIIVAIICFYLMILAENYLPIKK